MDHDEQEQRQLRRPQFAVARRVGRDRNVPAGHGDARSAAELRQIRDEHRAAANAIRQHIHQLGGHPDQDSGAWGAWAKTVQATMNLFGDTSSLKALREGEEHGLKDYQEALEEVDASSAQLIQNQLIPAQRRHINLLDQLINSVGTA